MSQPERRPLVDPHHEFRLGKHREQPDQCALGQPGPGVQVDQRKRLQTFGEQFKQRQPPRQGVGVVVRRRGPSIVDGDA
jgi:hypothetical protein